MQVGEIWRHDAYYTEAGRPKPKWMLILGIFAGDLVVRTLTSRSHLRSLDTCSHDPIKPHFALGVLNPAVGLFKPTWLDLLGDDDVDPDIWKRLEAAGLLRREMVLPVVTMCPLLECAIGAPGTTKNQAKAMYASRAALGC